MRTAAIAVITAIVGAFVVLGIISEVKKHNQPDKQEIPAFRLDLVEYDGCQYIVMTPASRSQPVAITHAGNCKNRIHANQSLQALNFGRP